MAPPPHPGAAQIWVSLRTPSLQRPDFWLLLNPLDAGAGGSEDPDKENQLCAQFLFPMGSWGSQRTAGRAAGRSSLTFPSKSRVLGTQAASTSATRLPFHPVPLAGPADSHSLSQLKGLKRPLCVLL